MSQFDDSAIKKAISYLLINTSIDEQYLGVTMSFNCNEGREIKQQKMHHFINILRDIPVGITGHK
uniref:Uncharacterized protein n=1 Tax=Onchocerca volvulus TaxID=6282 RepID=A0A8R1XWZ8_ONCVO